MNYNTNIYADKQDLTNIEIPELLFIPADIGFRGGQEPVDAVSVLLSHVAEGGMAPAVLGNDSLRKNGLKSDHR